MLDILSNLPEWLLSAMGSATIIAGAGALFKKSIANYFTAKIQSGFDTKLEELRSTLREKEVELSRISDFLAKSHFDRTGPLIEKRLQAAETALSLMHMLAPLSMGAILLQSVNIEETLKDAKDPRLVDFFDLLNKTVKIDENLERVKETSTSQYKLYLSEKALTNMEIYVSIVTHAALFIKAASLGQSKVLKEGSLKERIVEILPATEESFDKYGDSYAYFWGQYFYEQTFKELRLMASQNGQQANDVAHISALTISSKMMQTELAAKLENLPKQYLSEK